MRWFAFNFVVALTMISLNSWLTKVCVDVGFWVFFIVLVWKLSRFTKEWIPKTRVEPDNKAVLITGCDRGFGYNIAKQLCSKGYYVFAGCLLPDGDGAKELESSFPKRLQVLELDVTKQDHVDKAVDQVKTVLKENNKVLWAVVNNAGIGMTAEAEWGGIDQYLRHLDVNTIGSVRVTQGFLPLVRKSKGRIVLLGSVLGRVAVPSSLAYGMSKAAIIAFADGLRREMMKWNVRVISIEPSFYRTELTSPESLSKSLDIAWNNTPKEVQEAYGKKYLDGLRNLIIDTSLSARPHVHEVVNSIDDAVTCENPDSVYPCYGFTEAVRFWLARNLPNGFTDCISYMTTMSYTNVPEELEMAAKKHQNSFSINQLKQNIANATFNMSAQCILKYR